MSVGAHRHGLHRSLVSVEGDEPVRIGSPDRHSVVVGARDDAASVVADCHGSHRRLVPVERVELCRCIQVPDRHGVVEGSRDDAGPSWLTATEFTPPWCPVRMRMRAGDSRTVRQRSRRPGRASSRSLCSALSARECSKVTARNRIRRANACGCLLDGSTHEELDGLRVAITRSQEESVSWVLSAAFEANSRAVVEALLEPSHALRSDDGFPRPRGCPMRGQHGGHRRRGILWFRSLEGEGGGEFSDQGMQPDSVVLESRGGRRAGVSGPA